MVLSLILFLSIIFHSFELFMVTNQYPIIPLSLPLQQASDELQPHHYKNYLLLVIYLCGQFMRLRDCYKLDLEHQHYLFLCEDLKTRLFNYFIIKASHYILTIDFFLFYDATQLIFCLHVQHHLIQLIDSLTFKSYQLS